MQRALIETKSTSLISTQAVLLFMPIQRPWQHIFFRKPARQWYLYPQLFITKVIAGWLESENNTFVGLQDIAFREVL